MTLQDEMAWARAANLIFNGGMEVSQEKGLAAQPAASGYVLDGWVVNAVGGAVVTVLQDVDVPVGFEKALKISVTTPDTSIAVGDYLQIYAPVEGYRAARLGWGQGGAQSIALGFWRKANRAGIYSGAISNQNGDRAYTWEYTINAANTWEYKTVVVPGDVAGTWDAGNGVGMYLIWVMAIGTNYQRAAGSWGANAKGTANQINALAATTDTFHLTGASLIPGTVPVSAAISPQLIRPFDDEVMTAQRFYKKSFAYEQAPAQNLGIDSGEASFGALVAGSASNRGPRIVFPVSMRASPALTFYNPAAANNRARDITLGADTGVISAASITSTGFRVTIPGAAGTAVGNALQFHWVADARQ